MSGTGSFRFLIVVQMQRDVLDRQAPFTKLQGFVGNVAPVFAGKGLPVTSFRLVLAHGALAASLLIGATAAGQAAGALAIGQCGAYGFAYDYNFEPAAAQAALSKCAGGCKVVPVKRACGAIAIDGRNACNAQGYAVAPRLGLAQNAALKNCYQEGGKDCVIRAWACDAKG